MTQNIPKDRQWTGTIVEVKKQQGEKLGIAGLRDLPPRLSVKAVNEQGETRSAWYADAHPQVAQVQRGSRVLWDLAMELPPVILDGGSA